MALLTLKNIGKIYVSEGNVAVGIRGVNASLDRGEFVAVTGASGSGKSTMLNVISGMDTYEEGELFIEGKPTSHYLQKDWEEYRQKYISFIFQDYNIIDSFTVLQNVELALMDIESRRERRRRAIELLRRVGLEKHLHHKGSKLSGGQKQRTVIARALAKDSPLILADEPTGNLDSQSSKEIIELLHEVSKDKLVIVVTHNYDQLANYATRHIRIFDGTVGSDNTFSEPQANESASEGQNAALPLPTRKAKLAALGKTVKNGLALGRIRFFARPKLSVYLCFLMTVALLYITLVSSQSIGALELFDKSLLFAHYDGRVVLIRGDGGVLSEDELADIAKKTGALSSERYDFLLDRQTVMTFRRISSYGYNYFDNVQANCRVLDSTLKLSGGRAPENEDEAVLRLPISYIDVFGEGAGFKEQRIPGSLGRLTYNIVGVSYYYDNTEIPEIILTREGYDEAVCLEYLDSVRHLASVHVVSPLMTGSFSSYSLIASPNMPEGSYAFVRIKDIGKTVTAESASVTYSGQASTGGISGGDIWIDLYDYEDSIVMPDAQDGVSFTFDKFKYCTAIPDSVGEELDYLMGSTASNPSDIRAGEYYVICSPDVLVDVTEEHYLEKHYTQASLFFEDDDAATVGAELLRTLGYIAVPSYTELDSDEVLTRIMSLVELGALAVGWIFGILLATLFLSLCSSKAMNSTRGDIAIMRSMGISTPTIRLSIYIQTLTSLIPAFLVTAAACIAIFITPKTNEMFGFLHAPEYIFSALMMIAIAIRLGSKYVKRMFGESVKKTMRGGQDK